MIGYLITTHQHLPGVGLAKSGSWGGMRHESDAAAVAAAERDASGKPFDIRRETAKRVGRVPSPPCPLPLIQPPMRVEVHHADAGDGP